MRGHVATFDEHVGVGTIVGDDGVERFFHCTQIADGSRTIVVDDVVTFDLEPGHLGRYEAVRVSSE